MVEELDDVIESIADQAGRYGCHIDEDNDKCMCRVCFTTVLRARILGAVEVEAIMHKFRRGE